MRLAQLIRKGGLAEVATATPATDATLERARTDLRDTSDVQTKTYERQPVAYVATVAVADAQKPFDYESFDERAAIIEANGVPREWAEGYATLDIMPRPSVYASRRWEQIINDGGLFLDRWGRQASAFGWRAVDVFGVSPDAPENRYDCAGLVLLLQGRPIIAITCDTARIDCGEGVTQTFMRQKIASDAVALWELNLN